MVFLHMIITPYSRTHKVSGRVRNCISELESLAIPPKRLNEINDAYEMENLVDNLKLKFVSRIQIGLVLLSKSFRSNTISILD